MAGVSVGMIVMAAVVILGAWVQEQEDAASAVSSPELRKVAAGMAAVGVVMLGAVGLVRPISKTTWRAWLAGWWYSRSLQRNAVNPSGHPSARARRSVRNKASWAAQRQRDGRAAHPVFGSPVRQRIVMPRHRGDPA